MFRIGVVMNRTLKTILILSALSAVPILIGLPFILKYDNPNVMEVSMTVFGLLELLVMNIRYDRQARKSWRKKEPVEEENPELDPNAFRYIQKILILSGIINILLAVVYFQIFSKFFSK